VRCECRIVNWKYVTVGVGRLLFDMADVVCVVRGYRDVNVELFIGNMKLRIKEFYNLILLSLNVKKLSSINKMTKLRLIFNLCSIEICKDMTLTDII
jgi:hypothetical protein